MVFMETILKIKKIIVKSLSGKTAEIEVSGTPGPNSVGTEELIDEGVKKQDLEKDIQDKLDVLDDSNVVSEEELEESWKEAMHNAGLDIDVE